ncbi:MAG: tetratricopeptide repeat protein, partial [Phaeodactylibacter sp.]|nr:tetratricopeptide repeat protein [Phaeodactylibacter sp.]
MSPRYFCIFFLCFATLLPAQDTADLIDSLYAQGKSFYYDDQDYAQARTAFLQALELKLQQAQEDERLMDIYVRLAKSEGRLRLLEDAEQHFKKSLVLAEKLFGADSYDYADLLFELGNIYSSQYRPRLAIETFKQSLAIQKAHFGAESEDVAMLYMTIGYSLTKMSSYPEAEAYYQQAFGLIHRVSDPKKSKAFYRIYSFLGNLYRYTGDYDRAINYLTKSLELKAAYVGDENDPSLDVYYRNLARAYELNDEPEKALPLMQKSSDMTELHYGPEHSTRAGALGELGNIYADLGDYEKALGLYQESRRIQELSMPPTHPYVIATL